MINKKYIVGIIKPQGESKAAGVLLYDFQKRKIEKRGYDNAREAYKNGSENIIGFKRISKIEYIIKNEDVIDKQYIQLDNGTYNTNLLTVIDENDRVIIDGSDLCVGSIGCGSNKQFLIVNYKGETKFRKFDEVKGIKILGISKARKNENIYVITPCKNEFIDMEEYENSLIIN